MHFLGFSHGDFIKKKTVVNYDNWDVDTDTIDWAYSGAQFYWNMYVGGSSVKCSHIYCVSMTTNTVVTSEKRDWLTIFIVLSTKPICPFPLFS